ncbi:MAG: uroporphyrinogen decarboxylase family protein [Sedimentisphaerales bacterium]|nr:uroporphyrinogen decarboxylase family protein [Sedimentisphaerales bacterium]
MTEKEWKILLDAVNGKALDEMPIGFIIDSPWTPGWAGMTTLDYFSSEQMWLEANFKAIETFPEAIFLPGFWSEFGMCTEPSAFGTKCSFETNALPFAHPIINDIANADNISKPDPTKDGLLPFMLNRLKHAQKQIERKGHAIRFAVARGPLNIASFLLGTTEFLTGIKIDPEKANRFLDMITDFLIDWLNLQMDTFPTIDGIFVLDDIVGFLGEPDFIAFAKPRLQKIFNCRKVNVRFFHNDAPGLVCAPHLAEVGINLFNFSHEHDIAQMKKLVGNKVALLGNIPPRDVLGAGTPEQVAQSAKDMLGRLSDKRGIIASCGGGIPQNVPTENIKAFIDTIRKK